MIREWKPTGSAKDFVNHDLFKSLDGLFLRLRQQNTLASSKTRCLDDNLALE
jgi:hypothetical protein